MQSEIEVKAKVQNERELLSKLHEIGCKLSDPIEQDDTIYMPIEITDPMKGYSGLNVLRIRIQGDRTIFTLKQNRSNELDCLERETDVSDATAMTDIIDLLGFKKFTHVQKKRRKAKYKEYEICVDEVAGLGMYIEVEKMYEDADGEKTQNELFDFLLILGINKEDRVMHGYDTLIWIKEHTRRDLEKST
jgi:adenylate cyclase class 2